MSRSFLGVALSALVTLAAMGPSAAQGTAMPGVSEAVRIAQAQPADDSKPTRRSRKKTEGLAAAESSTKKEPTAGQMAARERQRKCGAEWKEAKAAGKTGGLKWPKFWSQCNARLKGKTV